MKLQVPFLRLPITFDAQALADEILSLGDQAWHAREDGAPGNSALSLVSAGGDPASSALAGPMRPTPWLDKCPYTMQVLGALGATWGRSRMMRLASGAQVPPHVDTDYYWRQRMRVHVPVITTPQVRFQCGDAEVHMAAGECWIFDTWRRHRVLNDSPDLRIHLVADTVGGAGLWDLVDAGQPHDAPAEGRAPRHVPFDPSAPAPSLDFETHNLAPVMGPWELYTHIGFLLSEAMPHPALPQVRQVLGRFSRRWHALWSAFGEDRAGWPRYRALLDETTVELRKLPVGTILLRNDVELVRALGSYVFNVALADRPGVGAFRTDPHDTHRRQAGAAAAPREQADPVFERPVFIVSPPRSGSTLLFEALANAPGLYSIGDESHALIEGVPGLAPAARDWASNRLGAVDATPEVVAALRARFARQLRDRDGKPPAAPPVRMLEKTPKNALRIPFLRKVFPEARFVYLHRDVHQVLGSMIDGWQSGDFVMYPSLPGWQGPAWSFLLVPGWRELSGRPLPEIVARQWAATTQALLDDLAGLPEGDWTAIDYDAFVADPQAGAARLCAWAGLGWDRVLETLPLSRYTMTPPDPGKWRRHEAGIRAQRAVFEPVAARAAAMLAAGQKGGLASSGAEA